MNQEEFFPFVGTSAPVEQKQLKKALAWWKTLSLGAKRTLVKNHSLKTIPDLVSCWIAQGKPEDGHNFKDLKKGDAK